MRPCNGAYSWRRHPARTYLIEIAGLRRLKTLPVERILPSQVEAFGIIIGKRLRDRASAFGRDYLRAVVDKVVVNGDTATISGSNAKLMRAVGAKKPLAGQVPSFIHDWCARRDCSRLRRSSSASLRTAAALRAAASNPALWPGFATRVVVYPGVE